MAGQLSRRPYNFSTSWESMCQGLFFLFTLRSFRFGVNGKQKQEGGEGEGVGRGEGKGQGKDGNLVPVIVSRKGPP